MVTDGMSAERIRAHSKLKEAEHQAAKGRLEQAIQLARQALETDPTYVEVRHWIGEHYITAGQNRRASTEYQEILHHNKGDEKAWAQLRKVDPAAAERLERLQSIAPDPFVMRRPADAADDLDDLGALAEERDEEESEDYFAAATGGGQEFESLEEIAGTDAVQPVVGVATPRPTPEPEPEPPTPAGPPPWLYEEDLKYREMMDRKPVFANLLPKIVEFWDDNDSWDVAISGSAHLDKARHPEIPRIFAEVAARFGTPPWALFVCPERRMTCSITRGDPPRYVVGVDVDAGT